MTPIKFIPIYFERVWGGRALETHLGRALPRGVRIGESREISDRPEAVSIIAEGDFRGQSLRQVLDLHGESVMGPGWERSRRFPLIVKWLDCAKTSSIQVHPTAESARKLGGEKKTEAWFFFHSEPSSVFFAGLVPDTKPEQIARAANSEEMEKLVPRLSAVRNACVLLEAGTVHAAGAGNLILEIQESSDTTYRLYDWNRRDVSGNLRELHIAESVASIDFSKNAAVSTKRVPAGEHGILCSCESFAMRKFFLPRGATWKIAAREQPRIVAVLDGELAVPAASFRLARSETALVPWAAETEFVAEQDANIIVTENFNHRSIN